MSSAFEVSKAALYWSKNAPGHIVFMIDQSSSMMKVEECCTTRAEKVAKIIQKAIIECLNSCICGTECKNRFFLTVIGYGGYGGGQVITLKEGWAKDIAIELQTLVTKDGTFIPVVGDGQTPMADAFELVKETLEAWLEFCKEKYNNGVFKGVPAPIIINITDGMPCDGTTNPEERTQFVVNKIMELSGTANNVQIYNFHISDRWYSELLFPSSKNNVENSIEGNFLYGISSVVDSDLSQYLARHSLDDIVTGSKCMGCDVSLEKLALVVPLIAEYHVTHITYL